MPEQAPVESINPEGFDAVCRETHPATLAERQSLPNMTFGSSSYPMYSSPGHVVLSSPVDYFSQTLQKHSFTNETDSEALEKSSFFSAGSDSDSGEHFPRPSDHASDISRASENEFLEQNYLPNHQPPGVFDGQPQDIAENVMTPREHPLYRSNPSMDGLYHCPWEGEDPCCNHRPEKLKCNYDKFVDSHLKPYRCKVQECGNARFSSTACLLRHEREAHVMHGHVGKPFLCTFEGCERGIQGNGFSRYWNLSDHMKRVHQRSPRPRNLNPRSPRLRSSKITNRIQNPSTLNSPRRDNLLEQPSDTYIYDYDDNSGLEVSLGQRSFKIRPKSSLR